MSRIIPIAIAAQDAAPTSTLCHALKIARDDGYVRGFVSTDLPIVVDGLTYEPGLDLSSLVSTSELSVDNMNITVLSDGDALLEQDLEIGLWDNAEFTLFRCNYRALSDGIDVMKRGRTGQAKLNRGTYEIEFRGLGQAFQQPINCTTSKTCRARFADAPRPLPNARCGLAAADWTETGSIDGVVSRQTISDSGREEADDWFGEGLFTFVSGANAGLARKVKSFSQGAFVFAMPFPYDVVEGDTYSVLAGCRKRRDEDCKVKFDNVLNFQGEPDLPGLDALTASPDPDV